MRTPRVALAALAIVLLTGARAPDDRALLDAARRGDIAAVKSLIKQGADPNAAQGDGLTALHLAAQQGNLEIAKALLGAKANVASKTRIGGYTPLHLAAQGAHLQVVKALLDAGADPAAVTTTSGVTPLHLAAQALNGEPTVRELVRRGAPVNAVEGQGQTALMFAAAEGRARTVLELLEGGADPGVATEVVNVLERMAIDKAAADRLREARTELRQKTEGGTERALTAAEEQETIAAQREYLSNPENIAKILEGFTPDKVARKQLLWQTPNDGPKSDVEILARPIQETLVGKIGGMTALLLAARDGHIDAARALLDGGADIDQVSGDGTSALVIALMNGQYDLGMMLIERGANPNIVANTDGLSALFATLQTQWAGFNTSQPQPKAHELQKAQHMDVLKALLEHGADPNQRLKTHIQYLVWSGQLGLDITGATPFWRAAYAQDLDAMKLLVAYGADPNIPTRWPEIGMRVARQQDGRIMDDSGIPRAEGSPNMYPLHAAAGGGWLGLGSWQVNAVPNNFLASVKYLVEEHGADVNLPDSWGYTPLHYAAVRGGNDLIQYLVAKGANVKAMTVLGQTAADMARGGRAGYFERVAYPETEKLLTGMGSPLACMSTIFRGTGDWCPNTGIQPWHELNADKKTQAR
jgi:ankyrin repeat protein